MTTDPQHAHADTDETPVEQGSVFQRRVLGRKPRTRVYELPADPNDSDILNKSMLAALAARNSGDQTKAERAEQDFEALTKSIPMMRFHLRSIGNNAYDALLSAWPATDEQIAEKKKLVGDQYTHLPFDSDEFPPRLLSHSISKVTFSDSSEQVDTMSIDDVKAMMTDGGYSGGDMAGLLTAAMEVNGQTSHVQNLLKG